MIKNLNSNENKYKSYLLVAVMCLITFSTLAILVETGNASVIDDSIRNFIYNLRSPWLTVVMKVITYMGNWQTITVVCIILLIIKKTRVRYGVPLAIGSLFVSLANKGVKAIMLRPRPDDIEFLIEQDGWSFPSGHSITSIFFFGMAIWLVRRNVESSAIANVLTAVLAIPMIFIGISRVYLGVHYPTDVIAGWALGILSISIIVIIIEILEAKKVNKDL